MKKKTIFFTIISDILVLLSFFILFATRWARRNYPMQLNRTVYFVMTSDISGNDSGTVFSIITGFVLPSIVSFVLYKLVCVIKKTRTFLFSIVFFVISAFSSAFLLKAWRYPEIAKKVHAKPTASEFYEKNYIDPKSTKIVPPEKKRNVIVVFMESMESSYFDTEHGGVFEKTPIPHLQKLANDANNGEKNVWANGFVGGENLEGTSWTVAGLLSKLCAVPYFSPFETVSEKQGSSHKKTVCLPNAVCLTDILKEQGYTSIFSIGSEKQFENRDALFESHNITVHDIKWYKENGFIPKDYQVFWGFEDEKLYSIAKKELDALSQNEEPFFYGFLTVDTHFPKGYKCNLCQNNFDSQMFNVLQCADNQIFNFLEWAKSQKWYENTTIVLLGDHCYLNAPQNNFIAEKTCLPKKEAESKRRFLTIILNISDVVNYRQNTVQNNRYFSSFDIMPTILEAMGNKIASESNDVGIAFGRSLFSEMPTLLEKYGKATVEKETMKRTAEYERLK